MRVLVDTVALIYAMESPQRLSRRAKAVFAGTRYEREVSALSLSEIAIKNRRGLFEIFERDLSRAGRPGNARPALLPRAWVTPFRAALASCRSFRSPDSGAGLRRRHPHRHVRRSL